MAVGTAVAAAERSSEGADGTAASLRREVGAAMAVGLAAVGLFTQVARAEVGLRRGLGWLGLAVEWAQEEEYGLGRGLDGPRGGMTATAAEDADADTLEAPVAAAIAVLGCFFLLSTPAAPAGRVRVRG